MKLLEEVDIDESLNSINVSKRIVYNLITGSLPSDNKTANARN